MSGAEEAGTRERAEGNAGGVRVELGVRRSGGALSTIPEHRRLQDCRHWLEFGGIGGTDGVVLGWDGLHQEQ